MKNLCLCIISILIFIGNTVKVFAYDYTISKLSVTTDDNIESTSIVDYLTFDYVINIAIERIDKNSYLSNGYIIITQYDSNDVLRHCDFIPYEYNKDKPFNVTFTEKHNDYKIVVKDNVDELKVASGGGGCGGGSSSSTGYTVRCVPRIYKIKAFMWNSLSNQIPLSEYAEIN